MRRGGALLRLALVAAAVATARAGGCSGARHALLPLQTANPHKYAHVACVHVVPGREAMLHLLVPAANFTGQESYAHSARKFAADLAGLGALKAAVSGQGSFVMVLGDDGSLPRQVLDRLRAARAPLVSHALRGADDVDRVVLGPDYHFIENDGFRETIAVLDARRAPLRDRAPTVFWRGSTTGAPVDAFREDNADTSTDVSNCLKLPRVQAALRAVATPWIDVGLSAPVQNCDNAPALAALRQRNLLHSHVQAPDWAAHRGVLEVDGNANAWGAIWRLASGSVVFKVSSPWVNAYNRRQMDWVHHVPIAADLADLELVTSLTASTEPAVLDRLATIAAAARTLAADFTYEAEVARVGRELDAVWGATNADAAAAP
jgi:hypothetical protein